MNRPPPSIAIEDARPYIAGVVNYYPGKRGLTFGQKIRAWMQGDADAGRAPMSQRELAKSIDEDQPTISLALRTGSPKLHIARKIAALTRMSLDYLADPDQPYPPQDAEAWDVLVGSLTPSQRIRLASTLAKPDVLELATRAAGPAAPRRRA